jgi:hypothetical protein
MGVPLDLLHVIEVAAIDCGFLQLTDCRAKCRTWRSRPNLASVKGQQVRAGGSYDLLAKLEANFLGQFSD